MSDTDKKSSVQDKVLHDYLGSLLHENEQNEDQISIPSVPLIVDSIKIFGDKDKKESTHLFGRKKAISTKPLVKYEKAAKQKTPVRPPVIGLDQLIAEVPDVSTQTTTEVATKTAVKVEIFVAKKIESTVNVSEAAVSESASPERVVPEWAETRFQCLLFNVSGLNLAVPLVKLNSVIPWDENITTTPNKTNWYLGLVQHLQNQVKIIDTALLVLPENRRQNIIDDSNGRLSHILLVDNFKWGLACSSIGDVIWLNKEEVKWRKNKTNKAWLSGTSLEHLCALMDTEVFAKMLTESTQ